jgi:hypothetical protein
MPEIPKTPKAPPEPNSYLRELLDASGRPVPELQRHANMLAKEYVALLFYQGLNWLAQQGEQVTLDNLTIAMTVSHRDWWEDELHDPGIEWPGPDFPEDAAGVASGLAVLNSLEAVLQGRRAVRRTPDYLAALADVEVSLEAMRDRLLLGEPPGMMARSGMAAQSTPQ